MIFPSLILSKKEISEIKTRKNSKPTTTIIIVSYYEFLQYFSIKIV